MNDVSPAAGKFLAQMLRLRLSQQFKSWGWRLGYLGFFLAVFGSASVMKASLQGGYSLNQTERPAQQHQLRSRSQSSLLKGVPIKLEASAQHKCDAKAAILHLGAHEVAAKEDISLTEEIQSGKSYWVVTLSASPSVLEEENKLPALAQLKNTLESYPKERLQAWESSLPRPPPSTQVLGWELRDPVTRTLASRLIAGMVLLMWLWPIISLFGGFVGLEWDMQRNDGSLEPWALVTTPLWVMYGAQILAAAFHLSAFCLMGIALCAVVIPGDS